MESAKRAAAVLDKAETELREIVSEALGRGDYATVTDLTNLAIAVAELRHSATNLPGSDSTPITGAPGIPDQGTSEFSIRDTGTTRSRRNETETRGFPRFERKGKRLVKLGWSSKDRRIYEQRAPFETVEEVCQRFADKAGSKKLFKIEKLLPMKTDTGEEIPSYQVYLVLKWLQQHGAVEKQGKDGYVVPPTGIDLKSLWDQTPPR